MSKKFKPGDLVMAKADWRGSDRSEQRLLFNEIGVVIESCNYDVIIVLNPRGETWNISGRAYLELVEDE